MLCNEKRSSNKSRMIVTLESCSQAREKLLLRLSRIVWYWTCDRWITMQFFALQVLLIGHKIRSFNISKKPQYIKIGFKILHITENKEQTDGDLRNVEENMDKSRQTNCCRRPQFESCEGHLRSYATLAVLRREHRRSSTWLTPYYYILALIIGTMGASGPRPWNYSSETAA